ncbi:TVG0271512 [Thermoplasma volcanium GSS1]|uniref:TVG0271512 protein n=1 Tax=Thermoplasma volcanium (strain ATCC 51530 / DSM 4299 / JCM 9571 / NBRC 15438 / GSS1) TaxID=273116 RepID=Q97C46_THEVO|nr:alkaline phosphatase family protein [Thermoplasma volcanium]BAB59401.1 TVG0271512 [Thermoplasma volcanium GSS1]
MIIETYDKASEERIDSNRIKPNFKGYNLVNVPNSILDLFGIKNNRVLSEDIYTYIRGSYDKIVFFYLDGLGYDTFASDKFKNGIFKQIINNGYYAAITTVFPSTTAAANTTINTGLAPLEHGLLEWILYFDEARTVALTLPYRPITQRYRRRFNSMNPSYLFKGKTIFRKMKEDGVRSVSFLKANIVNGEYTKLIQDGSDVVGYSYTTDGLLLLKNYLLNGAYDYYYFYLDNIDHIGHVYGPSSEMYALEVQTTSKMIEETFEQLPMEVRRRTLVIITSDHGHIDVDPLRTIYLNSFRKLYDSLKSDGRYKIPPVGSPRDVFLFVKNDALESTIDYTKRKLASSLVMSTQESFDYGLFGGGAVPDSFYRRAGNMLILPSGNDLIWYRMTGLRDSRMKGMHGGLSEREMMIPIAFGEISQIIKD